MCITGGEREVAKCIYHGQKIRQIKTRPQRTENKMICPRFSALGRINGVHIRYFLSTAARKVLRSSYFSLYLNRKYHPPSRTASFNCLIWTPKCTLSTYCTLPSCSYWQRGAVVSRVRRMNKVNARRARLVFGWVTVFGRVYHLGTYVTNQLGQLSLASLRGRLTEYQLRLR